MIKYGKHKSGSSKLHPHNVCGICGADNISVAKERSQVQQDLNKYYRIPEYLLKDNRPTTTKDALKRGIV